MIPSLSIEVSIISPAPSNSNSLTQSNTSIFDGSLPLSVYATHFSEDIFSSDGESHLSFLSNLELKNLRSSFEMNKIDSNSRINISRNKEIQVRIASKMIYDFTSYSNSSITCK